MKNQKLDAVQVYKSPSRGLLKTGGEQTVNVLPKNGGDKREREAEEIWKRKRWHMAFHNTSPEDNSLKTCGAMDEDWEGKGEEFGFELGCKKGVGVELGIM